MQSSILFYILPLLLLHLNTLSQASPVYFENSPTWYGEEYVGPMVADDMIGWIDEFTYKCDELQIELEEHDYHIISKSIYRNPNIGGPESKHEVENDFIFYVRQEGRKIYSYTDGQDSLFISYELNVGDYFGGQFGAIHPEMTVQKIDSILVGDAYRKQFFTDTLNDNFPDAHVLEGIGYFGYTNGEYNGFFLSEIASYGSFWDLDFAYYLNCYGELDEKNGRQTGLQNACLI